MFINIDETMVIINVCYNDVVEINVDTSNQSIKQYFYLSGVFSCNLSWRGNWGCVTNGAVIVLKADGCIVTMFATLVKEYQHFNIAYDSLQ